MVAVIFHNLQQAENALAAATDLGRPLTLLTAPGAAAFGGPGYYWAMIEAASTRYPDTAFHAILDCGDDGALAQMALGLGWRRLVLRGKNGVREKVDQIARAQGGEILGRPPKAVDPGPDRLDIAEFCRVHL